MVYIALYIVKGLGITGALYLLFVALCIGGYRAWRRHQAVVDRPMDPTPVAEPAR